MVDIEKLLSSARKLELKGGMLSKVRYRGGAGARVLPTARINVNCHLFTGVLSAN